ncbi:MAG: hypothetical protein ACQCXQ_11350 [Verrucomicrobiales bacterium]|nr:hypothetical protein [Verrucomicrobiota bacterium JB025]
MKTTIVSNIRATGVVQSYPHLPAEIDLNNQGFRNVEAMAVESSRYVSYDEEWSAFCAECSRRKARNENLPRVWNAPHN